MLRGVGAWPTGNPLRTAAAAVGAANAYLVVVTMTAELTVRTGDLKDFAYQAGFVLCVVGCLWNHLYLYLQRRRLAALLGRVRQLPWPVEVPENDRSQVKTSPPPGHSVDRLTTSLTVSYCAATASWAALSLFSDPPTLIYDVVYPFEWRDSWWIRLPLLLSHTAAGFVFDTSAAAFNGLYLKLSVLAGKQLRGVGCDLRGAAADQVHNTLLVSPKERMRECARRHCAILEVLTEMESVLSPVMLGHFIISELGICCVLFSAISFWQESILDARLVKMSICWLYLVSQISWLCWFGNYLTVEAENIRLAVYETNWENSPKSFKNIVFMMSLKASHPFVLTAGAFVPISLPTLNNILQQSISYFMVMVSLAEADGPSNTTYV